jgi:hypothetical protein
MALLRVRRTVYGVPVSDPAARCTVRRLIEADLEATDLVLKAAASSISSASTPRSPAATAAGSSP